VKLIQRVASALPGKTEFEHEGAVNSDLSKGKTQIAMLVFARPVGKVPERLGVIDKVKLGAAPGVGQVLVAVLDE
jgi:hypothetical protein